ncbi:cupin domain-containing protein [Streptomyces celluloflavus]|uniref:cupin domain-containing protein n=1 Tax=Streptomyces celluloflavus TaxID=58344 RepID=UPI0036B2BD87
MSHSDIAVTQLIAHYGLEPLPLEGGFFRATWTAPGEGDGRPAGAAIIALLTADGEQFSAMHRLPVDELWHFYLGDPIELLLLDPDGTDRVVVLGPDVLAGQHVQLCIPQGTWMGGRVSEGGRWSLFGCTTAPGFVASHYEGGDVEDLCARYPQAAERIRRRCRVGVPLRHENGSATVPPRSQHPQEGAADPERAAQ